MAVHLVTVDAHFQPLLALPEPVQVFDARPVDWLPTTKRSHRICLFREQDRNRFSAILIALGNAQHFFLQTDDVLELDQELRERCSLTVKTKSPPQLPVEAATPAPVVEPVEPVEPDVDVTEDSDG